MTELEYRIKLKSREVDLVRNVVEIHPLHPTWKRILVGLEQELQLLESERYLDDQSQQFPE